MEEHVSIRDLVKTFTEGGVVTQVLDHVSVRVMRGEYLALMGPSGSGKTTLLNLISGLDAPTSGTVVTAGQDLSELDETGLARWRRKAVGFVFQQYHLLSVLTTLENVELPLLLFDLPRAERRKRAMAALRLVGLEERASFFPRQLSGGQKQRAGIARAVVTDPDILIADEPTGNLDEQASSDVLDLFDVLQEVLGKTILMVTHDPRAAARAHRLLHLEKGRLSRDEPGAGAGVRAEMGSGSGTGSGTGAGGGAGMGVGAVSAGVSGTGFRS